MTSPLHLTSTMRRVPNRLGPAWPRCAVALFLLTSSIVTPRLSEATASQEQTKPRPSSGGQTKVETPSPKSQSARRSRKTKAATPSKSTKDTGKKIVPPCDQPPPKVASTTPKPPPADDPLAPAVAPCPGGTP